MSNMLAIERNVAVEVPSSAYTLEGFRRWARSEDFPENHRVTFINGALTIEMSPERYESHLAVKEPISRILAVLVNSLDLGRYYPDGAWFTNEEAGVSNEPDAMFASWATLQSGRLQPPDGWQDGNDYIELVGTPDWVCEVVSNSSERKDKQLLKGAYHRAGIREYWLIDARKEQIDFQLLIWNTEGYVAAPDDTGWQRSEVFEKCFRLQRDSDRMGRWRYELEVR